MVVNGGGFSAEACGKLRHELMMGQRLRMLNFLDSIGWICIAQLLRLNGNVVWLPSSAAASVKAFQRWLRVAGLVCKGDAAGGIGRCRVAGSG